MKIAVYTCMKNEEGNIQGWMDSARDADYVRVLDTGSTDATLSHIGQLAEIWHRHEDKWDHVHVHHASIVPWRFDVGLNTALALVPPDADICIQLAGDERLITGWRQKILEAWEVHAAYWRSRGEEPSDCFKIHYNYQFSHELTFMHDRIHSRRGYVWRYPFHEGLYPAHGLNEQHVWMNQTLISQVQNKTVDRMERDLALAEQARAEWPQDARMAFYVGRQLMYAGKWRDALKELQRYDHLVRQRGWEVPQEAEWVADAVRQCWSAIGRGQ